MNEPMQQGVPPEIRELLAQRSTFEGWLEKLDEVGGEYRPDVAERVREDYRARLTSVSEELESHRHELEASLEARRGRMQELTDSFDRQSAELEEAELRYKVGEFDDGTWEDKRSDYTEALEEIERELDGAREAVEELADVLARLGSRHVEEVLEKNGVPWVGAGAPRSSAAADGSVAAGTGSAEVEAGPGDDAGQADRTQPADETSLATPGMSGAEKGGEHGGEPGSGKGGRREEVRTASQAAAKTTDRQPAARASTGKEPTKDPAAKEAKESTAKETAAATAAHADARSESHDAAESQSDDYLDELEFLESLSLDDPDSFDAVSRMLEDEEDR